MDVIKPYTTISLISVGTVLTSLPSAAYWYVLCFNGSQLEVAGA